MPHRTLAWLTPCWGATRRSSFRGWICCARPSPQPRCEPTVTVWRSDAFRLHWPYGDDGDDVDDLGAVHAEHPGRLRVVEQALRSSSLPLEWREARTISTEEMARVPAILEVIEQDQGELPGDGLLEHTLHSAALVHYTDYLWDLYTLVHQRHAGRLDADTYLCPQSFRVALMAVGAVLDAIAAVQQPQHGSKLAFVACRPPGHHATRASGMGFCLLSNVAIGAMQALRAAGTTARDSGGVKRVERVGILDFDVHQGNGTENAVRGEPRVRFASLHEWPLYPMTGDDPQEHGPKRNLANFPLPAGTGWKNGYAEAYARALDHLWHGVKGEGAPGVDLLLVSAGYDALASDPLAHLELHAEDYAEMARLLVKRFGPEVPVVFCLEGGYDVNAIGEAVVATLSGALEARTAQVKLQV